MDTTTATDKQNNVRTIVIHHALDEFRHFGNGEFDGKGFSVLADL
jgi:hypothetical protein